MLSISKIDLELISVVSLMLAIVCVWMRPLYLWLLPFVAFLVTGFISVWLTPMAAVSIVFLGLVVRFHTIASNARSKSISLTLLVITVLVFAVHLPPGFQTLELLKDTELTQHTGWNSLRFTADKPLVGLFLLIAYRDSLCRTLVQLRKAVVSVILPILSGILCVFLIGLLIGYVSFDLTASAVIIVWFLRNLLFTVIAEEVFFRLVVQGRLEQAIRSPFAPWYALCVTALLFGTVHLYAGWQYGLLAALSGMVYGYAFLESRQVEAAIVAHVLLNLGHITLLSYPSLHG